MTATPHPVCERHATSVFSRKHLLLRMKISGRRARGGAAAVAKLPFAADFAGPFTFR
jgi:hypothetical protein